MSSVSFLLCRGGFREPLVEALDTACGIDKYLFAGVERVAVVADVNLDGVARRSGFKCVAAVGAVDGNFRILRVNILFHLFAVLFSCRKSGCFYMENKHKSQYTRKPGDIQLVLSPKAGLRHRLLFRSFLQGVRADSTKMLKLLFVCLGKHRLPI